MQPTYNGQFFTFTPQCAVEKQTTLCYFYIGICVLLSDYILQHYICIGIQALKQHLPFGNTYFSLSCPQVSAMVPSSKALLKAINHIWHQVIEKKKTTLWLFIVAV